jgi:hypothetical protein
MRGFEFFLLPRVPAAQCRQAESTPAPRRYPLAGYPERAEGLGGAPRTQTVGSAWIGKWLPDGLGSEASTSPHLQRFRRTNQFRDRIVAVTRNDHRNAKSGILPAKVVRKPWINRLDVSMGGIPLGK